MKFIGVLTLAAAAVVGCAYVTSTSDSGTESTLTHFVSTDEGKPDVKQVPNSDEKVQIFVDRNSIKEMVVEGRTFRTATVIYHLSTPVLVREKLVHYIVSEMAYHCETKLYVTMAAVLYDEDRNPLFKAGETKPAEAEDGTNVAAEMKYVCEFKTKKTSPKGKGQPAKTQKYTDI